jgi:hypothetical protein
MSSNNTNSVGNSGRLRRSSRAPKKLLAEFSVGDVVEVRWMMHDEHWNSILDVFAMTCVKMLYFKRSMHWSVYYSNLILHSLSFWLLVAILIIVVKIQRGSGTVQAQLVQLLTEGTASPNPRWLIRYVGNSKDDEVYEHSFLGKVGMNYEDAATTNQSVEQNVMEDDSPEVSDQQPSKKKRSEVTNDTDPVVHSDSSFGLKGAAKTNKASSNSSRSSNKNNALSSSRRDGRSRRRGTPPTEKESNEDKQQVLARSDDTLLESAGEINALATQQQQQQRKRKLTGAAKMSVETKRERESKTAKSSSTNNTSSLVTTTKPHPKEEEECVKIKFLTGTLYLYRGKRRRAEFIRRV